jgi:hypothetical protein
VYQLVDDSLRAQLDKGHWSGGYEFSRASVVMTLTEACYSRLLLHVVRACWVQPSAMRNCTASVLFSSYTQHCEQRASPGPFQCNHLSSHLDRCFKHHCSYVAATECAVCFSFLIVIGQHPPPHGFVSAGAQRTGSHKTHSKT